MSLFNIFNVSGSAMSAQAQRLNTVASNLANADSVTSASGEAYRAKQVVFEAVQQGNGATGVRVVPPFTAHAWIEADGHLVDEGVPDDYFTRLITVAPGSRSGR